MLVLTLTAGARAADLDATFTAACDLYEAGDFASAAGNFEALIEDGVRDAPVFYNLANCYYKQDMVGKAVAINPDGDLVRYRRHYGPDQPLCVPNFVEWGATPTIEVIRPG